METEQEPQHHADPRLVQLLAECHAVFTDLHGRLASTNDRAASIKNYAARIRAACSKAWTSLQTNANNVQDETAQQDLQADVEDLKTAHALFMCAEVSLDLDKAASVLSYLQWLRVNFMQPVTETQLASCLRALRGPGAVSDPSVSLEVWEVAAKLVLEGEPHDAGKLLALLATAMNSHEVATFAQLLCAFPLVAAASVEASAAYSSSWASWKGQMAAYLQAGQEQRYPPFTPGHRQYSAVFHSLAQVLAGYAWTDAEGQPSGLQTMPVRGLIVGAVVTPGDARPYARWYTLATATILYGTVAPAVYSRSGLVRVMRGSLDVVGMPVDAGVLKNGGSGLDGSNLSVGHLLASFVRILEGDFSTALNILPMYGQEWAAVHLCELLWLGGALQQAGPSASVLQHQPASPFALIAQGEGLDGPVRAHRLLTYAQGLSSIHPSLTRLSASYAYAATPQAALASCGFSDRQLRLMLGQCGQAGRAALASGLPLPVAIARADGSGLSAELRSVKLAVLSGSSATSAVTLHKVLLQYGGQAADNADESELEACLLLCRQVQCGQICAQLCCQWATRIMDIVTPSRTQVSGHASAPAGCNRPRLGSALLWFVRASQEPGADTAECTAGLRSWGDRVLQLLHGAVDFALSRAASGSAAGSGSASTQQILFTDVNAAARASFELSQHPDIVSIDAALGCLEGHGPLTSEDLPLRPGPEPVLTHSDTVHQLATSIPVFARLLRVRRLIECVSMAFNAGRPEPLGRTGAFSLAGPAYRAVCAAVALLVSLSTEVATVYGSRASDSESQEDKDGQAARLDSYGAASRMLRLGCLLGLLHARGPAATDAGVAPPAWTVEQALALADRMTSEEQTKAMRSAALADAAVAGLLLSPPAGEPALGGRPPFATRDPSPDTELELRQDEREALRALLADVLNAAKGRA